MTISIIPGEGELAEKIGYTPDKYFGWMYLDEDFGYIYIGQIKTVNRGSGDFSTLVRNINKNEMRIKIVNPSNEMTKICIAKGMKPTIEQDDIIWVQEDYTW
jgi:hypothetical protein